MVEYFKDLTPSRQMDIRKQLMIKGYTFEEFMLIINNPVDKIFELTKTEERWNDLSE